MKLTNRLKRTAVVAPLLLMVLVTILATGTSTAATAAPATKTVEATIDNFTFGPKQLTVKAGTTVRWTNKDDLPHTVTADDGVFSSAVLDTDQQYEQTFTKPGTYPYHCKLHASMTGVVVVQ